MLFIPNFIWTKKKPLGYEEASLKENKFLLALERIGEVLVSVLLLASTILGIGHIGIHLGHRDLLFGKKRKNLAIRILKRSAEVLGVLTVLILIGYFGIRNAKFIKAFASAKNPVFEDAYVNLNGQNQFIRVMG